MKNKNNLIQKNFNLASHKYDENALIQSRIAFDFFEFLQKENFQNKDILEIGAGTGILSNFFYNYDIEITIADNAFSMLNICKQKFPKYNIIHCDFNRRLNITDKFDYIISSMSLHWSSHLSKSIEYLKLHLKPHGKIAFTVPTDKSLSQLQQINRELTRPLRLHDLVNQKSLMENLISRELGSLNFFTKKYEIEFSDFFSLLKSFRLSGTQYKGLNEKIISRNDFSILKSHNNKITKLDWEILFVELSINN